MILKPGSKVLLVTPGNPRLNGKLAYVDTVTEWGAHVVTKAAATGGGFAPSTRRWSRPTTSRLCTPRIWGILAMPATFAEVFA